MKFRASYSILNSWSKGYAQDAIDMYFKLPRQDNKFMEEGRNIIKLGKHILRKTRNCILNSQALISP